MKKYVLIFLALWTVSFVSPPNTMVITGTITDAVDDRPLPGVNVLVKGTATGTVSDIDGHYQVTASSPQDVLVFSSIGYTTQEIEVAQKRTIDVAMEADVQSLEEIVVIADEIRVLKSVTSSVSGIQAEMVFDSPAEGNPQFNTEEYEAIHESGFREVTHNALSTFSIDVDAASYSNLRRFINQGQLPPKDAVRIEEMVNYFDYDYVLPTDDTPFSIITELSACPWNDSHQLLHVGLQGQEIPVQDLPPSNLVFLLDVSGSMDTPNKLPLLKSAFRLLVNQLRPQDRVAIVVYAGAAGVALSPTSGAEKETILQALNNLQAGGSTAGGEGIRLAYALAQENFQKEGNNRIILATDGDFNTGASSNAAMERLVEEKREEGVFLTTLGFGMGNYKDSKMELLADKGNGNYAYVDNIQEAKKVLVSEFGGTLFTIAKDVKLQLEFNPARVKAYRLIGYENRALANEDFHNDQKDAGELGAGHTVTAMYEIIPAGSEDKSQLHPVDDLKYQKRSVEPKAAHADELLTLKLRYKAPDSNKSRLLEQVVNDQTTALEQTSDNFRFAAAVAGFGMLLRDSKFKGDLTYDAVAKLAREARGKDMEGYRQEFVRMVESCNLMASQ